MSEERYPRARLDLYEDTILLTRYEQGERQTSYPVSADDLASAFAEVPVSSGFLPTNCLCWDRGNGEERLTVYVPGRRWPVQVVVADGAEAGLHIPLPPLLFQGAGRQYRVFALKERPRETPFDLYHFPGPNVHPNGAICQGTAAFPACTAGTIEAALSLFLEGSLFNGDLAHDKCRSHPDDVRALWVELDGKKRFPRRELVPSRTTVDFLV